MSIETAQDLKQLKRVGQVVKETLKVLKNETRVGISTQELDDIAKAVFDRYGARSAPAKRKGFPGNVLISINDEAVHGVPSGRIIQQGDVVKLDVTPELNGYIADAAVTVAVGEVLPNTKRLIHCARKTLNRAMYAATDGAAINQLGRLIEKLVKRQGFRVLRELGGHGTGRDIHEAPSIWNFFDKRNTGRLQEGMVITLEPIIAAGSGRVYEADDGWTIKTMDGGIVAHFEHTMVITKGKPLVLTA